MTGHMDAGAQAASEQHVTAVRRHAPVLVARTRQLVRNGVDLGDLERFVDFVNDQVSDAVADAVVPACPGAEQVAALVLIGELARQLAEMTR